MINLTYVNGRYRADVMGEPLRDSRGHVLTFGTAAAATAATRRAIERNARFAAVLLVGNDGTGTPTEAQHLGPIIEPWVALLVAHVQPKTGARYTRRRRYDFWRAVEHYGNNPI